MLIWLQTCAFDAVKPLDTARRVHVYTDVISLTTHAQRTTSERDSRISVGVVSKEPGMQQSVLLLQPTFDGLS